MAARRKRSGKKHSDAAGAKIKTVMHEWKDGELRSGRSGKKVTSQEQAVAIAISEARHAGARVPAKTPRRRASRKRRRRG